MLQVIDQRWRTYLTQMEHMREQIGFHGYGQMDPLIEYKQEAFKSFQELMAAIQRDIVASLFHLNLEAVRPAEEPAPTEAAGGETAPPSPRPDAPGSGRQGGDAQVAAARATAVRPQEVLDGRGRHRRRLDPRRLRPAGPWHGPAGRARPQGLLGPRRRCRRPHRLPAPLRPTVPPYPWPRREARCRPGRVRPFRCRVGRA